MLELPVPRRMNRVIPLSVRVRSTSLNCGWGEERREFVKVVALDPEQDMIFGPYLTPAEEWAEGYGIRVLLYTVPKSGVLDMNRDDVQADRSSGRGTFRADNGYYPRCLLASVPQITTADDVERAWQAITSDHAYSDCTRKLDETMRLRESTEKRLMARMDAMTKRRRALVQKKASAMLMCSMESPNQ